MANLDCKAAVFWSSVIPFIDICHDPYVKGWLEKMLQHEPSLHRHSLRVGRLVTDYYRFRGMTFERGWNLIEGALLHDIGKICIPAAVLTKPRGLNQEEKRMVALHPDIGAELLEAQGYFNSTVLNIVRRHHERLDGSGYPNGWRRKRTAKVVRIVAVCDALCAMTEDRPYEDAWPWQEAVQRLESMPNQYDNEVVTVIRKMVDLQQTSLSVQVEPLGEGLRRSKRASGVQHPRSAFYAPRSRRGVMLIQ